MLNSVILVGNLGNDPESFFTSEGIQISSFSLAFNSSRNSPGWIKVSCFGRTGDVASRFLHKGARVAIQGQLQENRWKADDGTTRSSFQITCQQIEFIKTDGRGFKEGKEGESEEEVPF